uniref:Si:ch211-59o9.10 n=1 Tax=Poecilia formosa TaxID=48698 RepID=A0A087Y7C0_POEFO
MAERFPASPGSSEPDSPRGLNRGCLLEPAEDLFSDLSVIVPETPSPQLGKRRRHRRTAEDLYSPFRDLRWRPAALQDQRIKSKRRRLVDPSVGFVPASSLRSFPLGGWLEAPSSSSSSSSSSSLSYSSNSSSVSYLTPESVLRSNQIDASASASPPAAASSSSSLSFLTDEERKWLNEGQGDASLDVVEQIVISDDEEATVRSLQMKEDEALARSLQAQFDHEESLSSRAVQSAARLFYR